jgi:CHASE2 domain-containing sensor protein
MIHAQIAAQILDGRSVGELKPVLSRRRSVLWMIITASLGALAIFGVLAAFAASRFYVPWGITLACWLLGMSLGRTIGLVRQPMSVAASQSND